MAVSVRYLLLFMGVFSTFCGLIYNDFASLPLYIGNTCFPQKLKSNGITQYLRKDNCVYGLGIDPVWHVADNGMEFMNSYKMKLSVIIGVLHMALGIVLKGFNAQFNKDTLEFYCSFLPQLIFLLILFGYMDIMIAIKWSKDWTGKDTPSLITQMVNIIVNSGDPGPIPLYGNGTTQQAFNILVLGNLHLIRIVVAILCVPWMLLLKPIIIYRRSKMSASRYIEEAQMIRSEMEGAQNMSIEEDSELLVSKSKPPTFNEICVKQLIDTFEFVLGSVSSTASYLRLWALSLAHMKLSEVFYDATLHQAIKDPQSTNFISVRG
jgi:V-type H+-transporting ATPase subunit a